jgi:caspase-like apoptosis-related cysteine protease
MYSISYFDLVHSNTEIACSLRILYILLSVSGGDHKNEDCLVVVVLTHGKGISEKNKENELYAYDETYETKTLWSSFTADVCPGLAGKPKIFIIQVSIKSTRVWGKCV